MRFHSLLFSGHHIQGQYRQYRAVHGHGDAHLIQWDALEQLAHIQDRVDCDPSHAHIARDAGVVGVIAAVCCQIECD